MRVSIGLALFFWACAKPTEPELTSDESFNESRSEKAKAEDVAPGEGARRSVGVLILGHLEESDELLKEESGEIAVGRLESDRRLQHIDVSKTH